MNIDFEGLAKILPIKAIYDDLLSRSFKEVGGGLEDFVRVIRRALPNMQLDAIEQAHFRKIIENPFFRVDPKLRTLPPSQLLGQVLEGVRYEPEGTPIWQMFEELLQRGYDTSRENEAHPSFAGIIRQLDIDEAVIIRELTKGPKSILTGYGKTYGLDEHVSSEDLGSEFPSLKYKKNVMFYAQHLEALGVLNMLVYESSEVLTDGPKAGSFR